jgi:DGQHR domain-containing protein
MEIEITVVTSQPLPSGVACVVGVVTAQQLVANFTIPIRDVRNRTGYQREASQSRVSKIAKSFEEGMAALTSPVVLNIENFELSTTIKRQSISSLKVRSPFRIVDGQHRILAIKKLADAQPDLWNNFKVPCLFLLGASEAEEMLQFWIMNTTGKAVRKDLAINLQAQQAVDNSVIRGMLERRNLLWQVEAQIITETMSATSPVWMEKISFPGIKPRLSTISNSSFGSSLKPFLALRKLIDVSEDEKISYLNAYWTSIAKILPSCFSDPEDYGLQKQTGVVVLHGVFPAVLSIIEELGKDVSKVQSYRKILQTPLESLSGRRQDGDLVQGEDFWLVGAGGSAGSYSSGRGQKDLTSQLIKLIQLQFR